MAVTLNVSDESLEQAAKTIRSGGTVIYPTETCYGLGCDATDEEAVERIYEIKQRPREKGLTVIVDSLETAERYCTLNSSERKLVEAFMPGPLTLVTEKREGKVPDALNSSFAFRIPGNETARRLAEKAGVPVVATSANVSGQGGKYSVEDIEEAVLDAADLVLDAGELEETPSSTVIALTRGEVNIYREGPVKKEEIEAVLDGS